MLLSTDWVAKRFCKWLLKNHLGGLLKSEVDLQQLDVQLGKGTLELRNVLLNCTYLNQQLASDAWEVSAGYVGCMRIVIPFTNLYSEPCTLHLDETLITLRPKRLGFPVNPNAGALAETRLSGEGSSPTGLDIPLPDANGNGQMGIVDGVQLIAGGLENVLQRLRVQATNATVRLEVPEATGTAPAALVVVRVDELSYSGEGSGTAAASPPPGVQLQKLVSFSGLTAELFEEVSNELAPGHPAADESAPAAEAAQHRQRQEAEEASTLLPGLPSDDTSHMVICSSAGAGCSGRLQLLLTWTHAAQLHPSIDATLALDPLQVQLQPHHLVLLSRLSHVLSQQPAAASPAAAAPAPAGDVVRPVAEARSFIEGMFLPDTTGLAQEFMSQSWRMPDNESAGGNSASAASAYDDFFNARSFMGSMQSSVSSFVSATAQALKNSDALSASSNRLASMLGPRADESAGASQPASPSFQLGLTLPELSLVLWYSMGESSADDLAEYRPRFSAECAELSVRLTSSADSATHASIHVARMEAVEHIPCLSATAAEMAILAQVTKVPEVLPATRAGRRPVPTFAGVSIVPLRRSLYSSTLSQLALSASFAAPADLGPQVQIWPVLSCLGASHAAGGVPCLSATLQVPAASDAAARSCGSTAEVRLRPISAWLSIPLLQRLTHFFRPLLHSLAQAQRQQEPAAAGPQLPYASPQRTEVARAIDSILDDLQEINPVVDSRKRLRQPTAASSRFQVKLAAPHVTLVTVLPPSAQGTPVCHGYGFAAIDIFSVPASSQDPAAGIPLLAMAPANPSPGENTLGAWDAESAIGGAKVYLVGSDPFLQELGFTLHEAAHEAALLAKCIVDVTPKPSPTANPTRNPGLGLADPSSRTALTLSARVQPDACTSAELLHQAWEHAKAQQTQLEGTEEADLQLQELQLQEAALASSHVRISLHAQHAQLDLNRADLAAICHLRDSFAAWQAQTSAEALYEDAYLGGDSFGGQLPVPASQVTFQLEACVHAQLHAPSQALATSASQGGDESAFTLEAQEVSLFSAVGLGGSPDASSLSLHARGVSLTEDHGQACLLHIPSSSAKAGLRFSQAQRSRDVMSSIMGASGPLPPLEALADVSIRGATLASGHADPSLPWLAPLGELFSPCSYASTPAGFQPPSTDWSAHLQGCALRYEAAAQELPDDFLEASQAVAAALLITHARWQLHASHPEQRMEVRGVSLWCHQGNGPYQVTSPVDMPHEKLMSHGYTCLAQEGCLSLAIHPADTLNGLSEVELTNERLRCFLTHSDLHTAQALASQLAASLPVSSSMQPTEPPRGEAAPPWDPGEPAASRGSPPGYPPGVRVMDGVQEDAFSGERAHGQHQQAHASVFLNGGWYKAAMEAAPEAGAAAIDADALPPSIPEAQVEVREDYMRADLQGCGDDSAEADVDDGELEARGFWYDDESEQERDPGEAAAPSSNMDEAYVKIPAASRQPHADSSPLAFQPLASHYPTPLSRLTLREANICIALCTEPPDNFDKDEGVPTRAPRVELDLSGVSLRVDTFPPGDTHVRRVTLSIRNAELRDCQPGMDNPPAWKKIVARHGLPKGPQEAAACLVEAALDVVSPSTSDQELRLYLAAMPLRVRLDQHVGSFLYGFFLTPLDAMSQPAQLIKDESSAPEEELPAPAVLAGGPYFQRCEIRGSAITFDYLPRHVDVRALRQGNLLEKLLQLCSFVPLSKLRVSLPHLRLAGYSGWSALGNAVGVFYMQDMRSQVPRFLTGLRAVRPLIRIGSAAGSLVAIPLELLRSRGSPRLSEGSPRGAQPRMASLSVSWQLQRSFVELLKTVVAETLGLSASAMGSLQIVLQGTNPHVQSTPADIATGLQQASSHISAGFSSRGTSPPTSEQLLEGSLRSSASNPTAEPYVYAGGYGSSAVRFLRATPGAIVAPIGATAAAARCALLGARNSLDPRHYEERRQSDA